MIMLDFLGKKTKWNTHSNSNRCDTVFNLFMEMIVVDSSAHSVVAITHNQDDLNCPALSYWPKAAFISKLMYSMYKFHSLDQILNFR